MTLTDVVYRDLGEVLDAQREGDLDDLFLVFTRHLLWEAMSDGSTMQAVKECIEYWDSANHTSASDRLGIRLHEKASALQSLMQDCHRDRLVERIVAELFRSSVTWRSWSHVRRLLSRDCR